MYRRVFYIKVEMLPCNFIGPFAKAMAYKVTKKKKQ